MFPADETKESIPKQPDAKTTTTAANKPEWIEFRAADGTGLLINKILNYIKPLDDAVCSYNTHELLSPKQVEEAEDQTTQIFTKY